MFLKSIFGGATEQSLDTTFYRMFSSRVDFYSQSNNVCELVLQNACISFVGMKDNLFNYSILVKGPSANDSYVIPINAESNFEYFMNSTKKTVSYQVFLKDNLSMILEFKIVDNDYQSSYIFSDILSKLLFQSKNKKPWTACPSDTQRFELIKFVDKNL